MKSINYKKGIAIGGVMGALIALILVWNKRYVPNEILSTLLIMFLPWMGAILGKYIQKKYFSDNKNIS